MALLGTAFLAIWHDVAPDQDAEYVRWHTREHMAERVGVPGFERGRRFVDAGGKGERYLTLYEATRLEVFSGADCMARLAAPTPWTRQVMPALRHLVRGACRTELSTGEAVCGAMLSARIGAPKGAAFDSLAARLIELEGVCGVHVGSCAAPVTEIDTVERRHRPAAQERTFDAVILVDALDGEALRRAEAALPGALAALGISAPPSRIGHYALSQMMTGRAA